MRDYTTAATKMYMEKRWSIYLEEQKPIFFRNTGSVRVTMVQPQREDVQLG